MPDPGNTKTVTIGYETLLRRADPTFYANRRKEPEYEFSRRTFYGDTPLRGAYGPNDDDFYLIDDEDNPAIDEGGSLIGISK